MKDLSDKKILIMDYRNNISVAERLAKDFGTAFYWCPYVTNAFPEHTPFDVGHNVPNIVKVKEWSQVYDESDAVMFTDSMEPHLQNWMRNNGKPVFGSVFAERLEHDRAYIKQVLKELGLPVGLYSVAHGLDALEQILMNTKEGYIKSSMRGNSETWKHKDWKLSKRQILKLRYEMGLYENRETYVVELPLDSLIEFGYDGFIVSGQYAPISMCGIERKDCCYLGKFIRYQWLPEQIRLVNDKLAPLFEEMNYNGHYSNEIILSKDKRGFLIDNSCRFPSPPGELMLEAYTNYSEIIWDIAHGKMPTIEYKHEWGAQLIIKSDIAEEDPSPILVPEEYKQYVKIKNLSIDEDGTWYFVPSPGLHMKEIGSIVFTADTREEVIKGIIDIAKSIQGFDTHVDIDSLEDAKKSLDKLTKSGINYI
jgi:hypothetical protein